MDCRCISGRARGREGLLSANHSLLSLLFELAKWLAALGERCFKFMLHCCLGCLHGRRLAWWVEYRQRKWYPSNEALPFTSSLLIYYVNAVQCIIHLTSCRGPRGFLPLSPQSKTGSSAAALTAASSGLPSLLHGHHHLHHPHHGSSRMKDPLLAHVPSAALLHGATLGE